MRLLFRRLLALCCLMPLLTSCVVPQISAEARTFLNLSVEYLDQGELAQTKIDSLSVGGLSGLTYDRQSGKYWAIADAKDNPRAFELNLTLDETGDRPKFGTISVERLVPLAEPIGAEGEKITLDPEGIAPSADQQWYMSSEGFGQGNPPLIGQFSGESGDWITQIPTPTHYLPEFSDANNPSQTQGIYPNLGFESLTANTEGDRLFTATEAPLVQDAHADSEEPQGWVRFLHYWVGVGDPYVVAEHVYPVEPPPLGSLFNGLSEILYLDGSGHFLALERAVNPLNKTYQVSLYQAAIASATDVISVNPLPANLGDITPIQKKILLDFSELDIELGNLEGMTFGPRFADGSRSLILVSDNGFKQNQPTQFLLFKLTQSAQQTS